jgi:hypothetical protein
MVAAAVEPRHPGLHFLTQIAVRAAIFAAPNSSLSDAFWMKLARACARVSVARTPTEV